MEEGRRREGQGEGGREAEEGERRLYKEQKGPSFNPLTEEVTLGKSISNQRWPMNCVMNSGSGVGGGVGVGVLR